VPGFVNYKKGYTRVEAASNKMGKQKIPLHQNSCKILLKIVDLETKIDITKHTHKTKDRVTRTLLKTGGELKCPGRVNFLPSTEQLMLNSHKK
jgi:hypothetical protein